MKFIEKFKNVKTIKNENVILLTWASKMNLKKSMNRSIVRTKYLRNCKKKVERYEHFGKMKAL